MKRLAILFTAALLVVVGCALWLLRPTAKSDRSVISSRLSWPQKARSIYALSWETQTSGLVLPEQGNGAVPRGLEMHSRLDGEVAIEAIDANLVALSFARVDHHEVSLQGQKADDGLDTKLLEQSRAYLSFTADGTIGELRYDDAAPPAVRQALRGLALQIQFTHPTGDSDHWEAVEPVAGGALRMRYHRDGAQLVREPAAIERIDSNPEKLDGKAELGGSATFRLANGAIEEIDDRMNWSFTRKGDPAPLMATHYTFHLVRKRGESFDAVALKKALPHGDGQSLSAIPGDEGLDARRDGRLAKEMSVDKLLTTIDHFEQGARPGHEFVVRAGAYLRLHPEAVKDLLTRFDDPGTTFKGRGLVLDVMVAGGDANAQNAMRTALSSKIAHEKPGDYGVLVQRFTLLDEPLPDSEKFLEAQYRQAKSGDDLHARQGLAATLGAVADRLAHEGQPDLARQANALLVSELESAKTPALKRALLAGLGNAKRSDDLKLISSFAGDEDAQVRAEAAAALRGIDDASARSTLLGMLSDRQGTVAQTAMDALGNQTLSRTDWETLSDLAQTGRVSSASDARLVRLIRERREGAGPEGGAILRAILSRNSGGENTLGGEIEHLLSGS